jgi:hypothetical protein
VTKGKLLGQPGPYSVIVQADDKGLAGIKIKWNAPPEEVQEAQVTAEAEMDTGGGHLALEAAKSLLKIIPPKST